MNPEIGLTKPFVKEGAGGGLGVGVGPVTVGPTIWLGQPNQTVCPDEPLVNMK